MVKNYPLLALLLLATLRLEAFPSIPSPSAQLLRAAQKGDITTTRALLKRGVPIDTRDATGATPLIIAAKHENADLMDILLKHGADIHARDKSGFTCLGYFPSGTGIEQLVKWGAKATPNDSTVLSDWLENDIWSDSDATDDEVRAEAKLFLQAGVNLNTRGFDESGTTPLMNAIDSRPSFVAFLLSLGADPNIADSSGRTPLIASLSPLTQTSSLSEIDETLAFALLAHGAKVNARGPSGETALMLAADAKLPNLARELIKRGAEPNIRDNYGMTALMRAASSGCPDIARLLIASGALTGFQTLEGETALDFAKSHKFVVESWGITSSIAQEKVQAAAELTMKGRLGIQQILEGKGK